MSDFILQEKFQVLSEVPERLDLYLSKKYAQFTRSFIKNLIQNGLVEINGKMAKPASVVLSGDMILFSVPKPDDIENIPQDLPLDIVYQDKDIAVINKPKGMVAHPAAGNWDGTLVNALLFHMDDLSGINGRLRPGIVHRLDKDTSGLMVIAKNDNAHQKLAQQIKNKEAYRVYLAIVHGNIKQDEGTIEAPIGRHKTQRKMMAVTDTGREAVTHFSVLERFRDFTLIEARLQTGRTHQIRVHMKHIGHPVAGDAIYGPKKEALTQKGQLLHAFKLGITHPSSGEKMVFEAPPDEEFARVLNMLKTVLK